MNATTTERLATLSIPKKNFQSGDKVNRAEFVYSCGRSSVIWPVSPTSLEAKASARMKLLAAAKQPPPEFQEDRYVATHFPLYLLNPHIQEHIQSECVFPIWSGLE